MNAPLISNRRGMLAAYANLRNADASRVLAELQASFDQFRDDRDAELNEIRAQIDELHAGTAALQVGTQTGTERDPDASPAAMKAAKAAMAGFARTGKIDIKAGLSSSSDPDGGYTVEETLSNTINVLAKQISPMAGLASHVTLGKGDMFEQLVDESDIGASWVGETEARDETTSPTLHELNFPLMEQYANIKATQKLLDDSSFDISGWLMGKIGTKFAQASGSAFITGNGVKKPRGILSYTTVADASYAWGSVGYKVTGVAGAINDASNNGVDALIDMVYSLKVPYRANASWLMNRATAGQVRKLKDSYGRYLWSDALQAGEPPMLLGHPVHLDEEMPDVGANAFPIAFGDFRQAYLIVDRPGIRLLRDPYTNKPYVHFYVYGRVGGGVQNFEAFKLLKVST